MKQKIYNEIYKSLNNNPNKIAIINKLLAKKGQIVLLNIKRPLALLQKYKKQNIIGWKYSTIQVRAGVEYNNLTKIIEKRAEGEKMPEPLRGRKWIAYPYILRTTTENPKVLFRFYTVNNNFKPKIKYVIDNFEVQKEDLPNYCLASEYIEQERDCFDLSIDAIEDIK